MPVSPQNSVAMYDLSVMPTTFDFACYAVIAKTLGYERINFVVSGMATHKYEASIGWRRWANICIPLCGLAGLQFSVGEQKFGDILAYHTGAVEQVFKKQGRIEKLKPNPKWKFEDSGYVTITMRESFRNTWRNSDREAWAKVGGWLAERGEKIIVLEECEMEPMAVEKRMTFYSQAKMNLAVGNGPPVLCWLSEAPYLTFQLPHREGREKDYDELVEQWNRMRFPVGSQLPWRNDKQEIVWGPDDFETITTSYERMFAVKQEQAADLTGT